ncbi:MAG: hypothetical protein ACXVCY_18855, partial [Pseudobdellovibrionaceae bacterium]
MRIRLLIPALVLLSTAGMAATRNAASCSFSDVSSAYSAASDGDTVLVPSGNCTWSNTLSITKAITLQGAGSTSTVITSSMASYSQLIAITPASDALPARVTGFGFQLGNFNSGRSAIYIYGRPETTFIPKNIRIDHNAFTGGGGGPGGIVTFDQVYG